MIAEQIEKEIQQQIGARNTLVKQVKGTCLQLQSKKQEKEDIIQATEIIQCVAQLTQKELEYHISEVVTLALQAVFPRPYKLILKFVLRRNRTEADILLEDEEGNQVSPMDATGGGVVDIASFALRIALWTLSKPRLRNTIILDEPFRFLSSDLQNKAGAMLRELSDKLKIQFIIITHEEQLLSAAEDGVIYNIVNKKGVSCASVSDSI